MDKYKNLVLRANRHLGNALMQLNLVNEVNLGKANEKLVEALQSGQNWKASLLRILIYELEVMNEEDLLSASKYPLIDLRNFDLPFPETYGVEYASCEATYTMPFYKDDNFYFLATVYGLSEPVVEYWEDILVGNKIWYTTDLASISWTFDRMNEQRLAKTEEAGDKEKKT